MRLLVTGSNGFLGSEIIRQFLASGFIVRSTDRGTTCSLPGTKYIQADILISESLIQAVKDIDTVVHVAGLAHMFGGKKTVDAPFKRINEIGTENVANAAAQAHLRHLILISSVSVYGINKFGACDENSLCLPEGAYAESKYMAEQRAIEIVEKSEMNLTILRLGTAYGEGDPGNVNRLIRAMDRHRFIGIAPGLNRKSLIHRKDVGRACLAVLQNPPKGINIFNVAGQSFMMKEIVEEITCALGRSIPRWYIPSGFALNFVRTAKLFSIGKGRLSDLFSTMEKWLAEDIYDSTKFEKAFNFTTQVGLREGIKEEVAWYRRSHKKKQ